MEGAGHRPRHLSHGGEITCRAPGVSEFSHHTYSQAVSYVRRAFGEAVISQQFAGAEPMRSPSPDRLPAETAEQFFDLIRAVSAQRFGETPFDQLPATAESIFTGQRGDGTIGYGVMPDELTGEEPLGAVAESLGVIRLATTQVTGSVPLMGPASRR